MCSHEVLYISYDGMTDPLGQSQVIPYLQGLSQKGYRFTLISLEKEHLKERRPLIAEILHSSNIDWHPIAYSAKVPVFSALWNVQKIKSKALHLHKKKNFGLLHCRSYLAALVGEHFKLHKGIPFIFDMRGFWPDERVDGGLWPQSKAVFKSVYNYMKSKEKDFIANADAIVSLTHNAKTEIKQWKAYQQSKRLIEVIPCCADLNLFDPSKVRPEVQAGLKQKLGIEPNDFVLLYLGAVGTWYMLQEMLEFFQVLLKEKPNAKFLFVTAENKSFILDKAAKLGIPKEKLIITKSPREEVPAHISLADLAIFFILPVYSKKASSPTKQAEIMAMNLPVVCNSGVGDTDYVIETYGSGCLVNDFNENSYQDALTEAENLLQSKNIDFRKGAEGFFSLEKGVESYQKVYRYCLNL